MPDPRFFQAPLPQALSVIAAKCGAELGSPDDGDFLIHDVAALDQAGPQQLSFLDNRKYRDQFSVTKAGAVIIHPDMRDIAPKGVKILLSKTPYKSYALAAQFLYPEVWGDGQISGTARVHPTAKIGMGVTIGDYAVIAEGAEIGDGTWIEPHAVIGRGVLIGRSSRIGVHATVSHAIIGDKTRLYPGVCVGQDGFGFAIDPSGYVKVPQLGRVIVGSGIEIGAGTTIDRGASGDTIIGDGTWIDNLVQVAHNVKIGKGCIIAAQVGIAGSTEIGDYVMIAGQVGVSGHLKVGSLAKIAAKSGVTKNIPAREEWMGYPAVPMKRFLRQTVTLNRLVEKQKKET